MSTKTTKVDKQPSFNRANQRLSQSAKVANDNAWYKQQADLIISKSFNGKNTWFSSDKDGTIDLYIRKKANYDLFNNIINPSDFKYVTEPFGSHGSLPANFTNRDIVSTKIKVLLGMEMSMPFSWRVFATNEEATTRKEQEETGRIRDYVISSIMSPIRQQVEMEHKQQIAGRKLAPQEQQQIQQQIEAEIQSKTPDEVSKYMTYKHQDPAERLGNDILNYLVEKEKLEYKFNLGWKHFNLSGIEAYHVGIFNDEPGVRVVNSLRLDHDVNEDLYFIEDGEWAVCDIPMSPTQAISIFHDDLNEDEIDRLLDYSNNPGSIQDSYFSFDNRNTGNINNITVKHIVWKSLAQVGFLKYIDEEGQEQMMLVDENYQLNEEGGDIEIEWVWYPRVEETFRLLNDMYKFCRAVPGQEKTVDNLFECKLPYHGVMCDNLNSQITSPMDRMKSYQYMYDIILYRIELLMASDRGKVIGANLDAIPKSIPIDKWLHFLQANKVVFFSNKSEEMKGSPKEVSNIFTSIDLSLINTIDGYIKLAEYIDTKCGLSVGVTKAMEAQIAAGEAVSNTRQNITQSSYILKPYFELHNQCKKNVLSSLIDKAKIAFRDSPKKYITYVMSDMSLAMFKLDKELLENSVYGLFVANSGRLDDIKQNINQLAQAAIQNQQADILDVIKILKTNDINEAEELLEVSMQKRQQAAQQQQQAELQQKQNEIAAEQQQTKELWQHEEDMIVLKEEERRKTEIQKQAILSMGFDTNKDEDEDGIPDVLEVAKFGVDADIKRKNLQLQQDKFEHEKERDGNKDENDKKKLELENKRINKMGSKPASK